MPNKPSSEAITGVILAGGLGQRMGGIQKGLQVYAGQPLVVHVAQRLAPQVQSVLINANQVMDAYRNLGFPVFSDFFTGYAGPLAGLHAALMRADTDLVITVPCDSPHLPADLVTRLLSALSTAQAEVAIARTPEREHPVFCLCKRSLHVSLLVSLENGERRFLQWFRQQNGVVVEFEDEAAFRNFNTLADLA